MWRMTLFLPFFVAATVLAAEELHVVISEVMWMGSDLSTADEWVELAAIQHTHADNESGLPLSLSGWTLTRLKDGEEVVIVQFGSGVEIGSGQFLLISNYEEAESRLVVQPDVTTKDMVLANSKLLLRLRDADGNVVDSVDDGVGEPFAGRNDTPKASMERIDLVGSGGLKGNWQTATVSKGFDDGIEIYGTPGYSNSIETSIPSIPLVFITELLPDSEGKDADREWIEVGNFSTGSVSLAGWVLHVGDSNSYDIGSGVVLAPGSFRLFPRPETGLSLRNSGDFVKLLSGSSVADSWQYPELPEGVSYGRSNDGQFGPFCAPSPGRANSGTVIDPFINVQSGQLRDWNKVTVNLQAAVLTGSLADAACSWDFGDGYTSTSCNPPAHSFRGKGTYTITMNVTSFCGDTEERQVEAEVLGEGVYREPVYDFSLPACVPSVSTGIVISDFLPDPEGKDSELEWIELQNTHSDSVTLCGWTLDDAEGGSDPFLLDEYEIKSGETLHLPITETKIVLNNDGDSVRLFFNGELMQEIVYEKIKEGETYSKGVPLSGGAPPPLGEDQGGGKKQEFLFEAIINEVFPAPEKGGQEFIELFNPTDHEVDLSGWILDDIRDGGSKPWAIPGGTRIASGSYIVFYQSATSVRLNNDGDEVLLVSPDGTASGSISYEKMEKGMSLSRVPGRSRWCEGRPTPLRKNKCVLFFLSLESHAPVQNKNSEPKVRPSEPMVPPSFPRVTYRNHQRVIPSPSTGLKIVSPIGGWTTNNDTLPPLHHALLAQVVEEPNPVPSSKPMPKDAESILVAVSLLMGFWGIRLRL